MDTAHGAVRDDPSGTKVQRLPCRTLSCKSSCGCGRDFANGFLLAEILCRYFPKEIQLHSFVNVTSRERKARNWNLLGKFFKKHGWAVTEEHINAVMTAQPDAAVTLLMNVYGWLHGRNEKQQHGNGSLPGQSQGRDVMVPSGSLQQSDAWRDGAFDRASSHRQLLSASMKGCRSSAPPYRRSNGRSGNDRNREATGNGFDVAQRASHEDHRHRGRAIDWNVVLRQPDRLFFVENGSETEHASLSHSLHSTEAETSDPYISQTAGKVDPLPFIASQQHSFNPVSFNPHLSDITSSKSMPTLTRRQSGKGDKSTMKEYWVLGKLGPDMRDPTRLDKQRLYRRVQEFSRRVYEVNKSVKRCPMEATSNVKKNIEPPRRLRALEYSRSIPKPSKRDASFELRQKERNEKRVLSELQCLEREHEQHKQRMQAIAAEMHRRGM